MKQSLKVQLTRGFPEFMRIRGLRLQKSWNLFNIKRKLRIYRFIVYGQQMKKRRWNLFADTEATERYLIPDKMLPVLPQSARGEISHFAYDKKSGRLMVDGWATDVEGTGMVGGVILEIDGRPYPACYGLRLDDATRNQKDIRVMNSGFARVFSVRALGKGEHLLNVRVLTRDRSAFFASPAPTTFRLDN